MTDAVNINKYIYIFDNSLKLGQGFRKNRDGMIIINYSYY